MPNLTGEYTKTAKVGHHRIAAAAIGLRVAATPAVFLHAGSPPFRGHGAQAGVRPRFFANTDSKGDETRILCNARIPGHLRGRFSCVLAAHLLIPKGLRPELRPPDRGGQAQRGICFAPASRRKADSSGWPRPPAPGTTSRLLALILNFIAFARGTAGKTHRFPL